MSHVYDVQRRIWNEHVRSLVVAKHGEMFAFYFEALMEEMHSANHDVPSRDGVFKGDGINKDPRVCRAARELEEYVREMGKKAETVETKIVKVGERWEVREADAKKIALVSPDGKQVELSREGDGRISVRISGVEIPSQ